jgi:hypothetical protein
MPIELDVKEDFALVCDGLEAASLRRKDGATVTLVAALRTSHVSQEAAPSGGFALQADATWRVQLPDGELAPAVGETIIDDAGRRWTILELKELRVLGAWECQTRDLRVAFGCLDRVDIERPVWEEGESGREIAGWNYVLTAVPVRIQPEEIVVDDSTEPPSGEARYRVIFDEQVALEPHDRLVAGDGAVYRVERFEQAERIDALPVATVVRDSAE